MVIGSKAIKYHAVELSTALNPSKFCWWDQYFGEFSRCFLLLQASVILSMLLMIASNSMIATCWPLCFGEKLIISPLLSLCFVPPNVSESTSKCQWFAPCLPISYPISSMVREDLPTFTPKITQFCRFWYTSTISSVGWLTQDPEGFPMPDGCYYSEVRWMQGAVGS